MGDSWTSHLITASVQGTVGLIVVWGICLLLPRIPASWRCWMWRLALVKMVVALFIAIPIFIRESPVVSPSPVVHAFVRQTPPSISRGIGLTSESAVTAVTSPAAPIPWLLIGWGLGSSLVFVRAGAAWLRTLVVLRRRAAGSLGKAGGVRTLSVEGLAAPGVIGVVRPTILLPRDLSSASSEVLGSAVAHEMAHVRRGDVFWNLVAEFCRGVFWFHPLVWLACREQHAEAEIAADALARSWVGLSPRDYGRHLLQWLRPAPEFSAPGVLFSTDEITRRITAMSVTRYGRRSSLAMGSLLAIPVALVLVPATLVARDMEHGDSNVTVAIPVGNGHMKELFNIDVSKRNGKELDRARADAFRQSAFASTRIDVSPVGGNIYSARLDDGRKVELLGLTHWDPGHMESWSADGTPLPALLPFVPIGSPLRVFAMTSKRKNEDRRVFGRQAIIRVSQPGITGLNGTFTYPQSFWLDSSPVSGTMPVVNRKNDGTMVMIDQCFPVALKSADLIVRFFDPPKTIGTTRVVDGVAVGAPEIPTASIGAEKEFTWDSHMRDFLKPKRGDTILSVSRLKDLGASLRISVIDKKGREFQPFSLGNLVEKAGEKKDELSHWLVRGLAPKDVAGLRYSVTYMREVRFLRVHLHPNK